MKRSPRSERHWSCCRMMKRWCPLKGPGRALGQRWPAGGGGPHTGPWGGSRLLTWGTGRRAVMVKGIRGIWFTQSHVFPAPTQGHAVFQTLGIEKRAAPTDPGPREARLPVESPVGPGKTKGQIMSVMTLATMKVWVFCLVPVADTPYSARCAFSASPTQPQRPWTREGPHGNPGSRSLLGQRGRFAESQSRALMTRAAMTCYLYSGGLGHLSFPELLTLQVRIWLSCLCPYQRPIFRSSWSAYLTEIGAHVLLHEIKELF